MTGFHTFFYLPDILPCHLTRCYPEPIACGLFTSSFHHVSKSRQTNEARKRALPEAAATIMTTRSLRAVPPLNSKRHSRRCPCLNCWQERSSVILEAGCSSGSGPARLAPSLPPCGLSSGLLRVRSFSHDDSGSSISALTLAAHLFLTQASLLHQVSHRVAFI